MTYGLAKVPNGVVNPLVILSSSDGSNIFEPPMQHCRQRPFDQSNRDHQQSRRSKLDHDGLGIRAVVHH